MYYSKPNLDDLNRIEDQPAMQWISAYLHFPATISVWNFLTVLSSENIPAYTYIKCWYGEILRIFLI